MRLSHLDRLPAGPSSRTPVTDLSLPPVDAALVAEARRLLLEPAAARRRPPRRACSRRSTRTTSISPTSTSSTRGSRAGASRKASSSRARSPSTAASASARCTARSRRSRIPTTSRSRRSTRRRSRARDRPAGAVGGRAARPRSARARSLYLPQDPVASLSEAAKVALLERLEQMARARDPRVVQVMASLAGEYEAILVARSDGLIAADVRPLVRVSLTVIVEEDGRREQGYAGGGGRFDYGYFTEAMLDRYARQAVDQALLNLGARDAPAGTMTVVLGHGWPGILLHEAIGHGLEGDFNRKGTSAFAGRVGQRVAAKGITVVDDGTIAQRRGSLNVDDEGNPTQRTVLIEDGILKGYMQDQLNARLMGVAPTGNGRRESFAHLPMPRMTNTHHAGRRPRSGGDHRVGAGRPLRGQLRRRPGRHHQRQVRVLGGRGVEDRERQARLSGQGRDADRQRAGRADARVDGRQRPRARRGRRHLRQGRPERAGRRRPADAARSTASPSAGPPDRRHRRGRCPHGHALRDGGRLPVSAAGLPAPRARRWPAPATRGGPPGASRPACAGRRWSRTA